MKDNQSAYLVLLMPLELIKNKHNATKYYEQVFAFIELAMKGHSTLALNACKSKFNAKESAIQLSSYIYSVLLLTLFTSFIESTSLRFN